MKTAAKHIMSAISALSAIAAVFSCTREGIPSAMPSDCNLAVNAKAGGVPVFAYLPDELKAGNYTAITQVNQKDDNYYYRIPDGTTKVIFSNISGKETERVEFMPNESGLVSIGMKPGSLLTSDILVGSIDDFIIGNDNPYSIQLKRLNAELETNLRIFNDKDEELDASSVLKSATVTVKHLGTTVDISEDLSASVSGDLETAFKMTQSENVMKTEVTKFIPSSQKCELTVTVTDSKDRTSSYSITLDRIFEFNRSYTVNLKLRKENSYDSSFSIMEPEVSVEEMKLEHNSYGDYDMFNVSDTYVLNKDAESSAELSVTTAVPIEWSVSVTEGSEFISATKTDNGNLLISALSENTADTNREAIVRLVSFDGLHSKIIAITQLGGNGMQTIKFIPGNDRYNINATGAEIMIYYGTESHELESGKDHYIPSDYSNSEITIAGSAIQKVNLNASDIVFENCTSISDLTLGYEGSEDIDISCLANLRHADISGHNSTGIIFADGQPVESISISHFYALENLDMTKIADHLQKLEIYYCSKMKSITIYSAEYSKERNIQFLSISECDAITGISVSNYTNLKTADISNNDKLESLNLSGCSSLESLNLSNLEVCKFINIRNCTSLKDLILNNNIGNYNSYCETSTDNTPEIENVFIGNYSYIKNLDLSGHEKLLSVCQFEIYDDCYIKELNLDNCPSLKTVGKRPDGHRTFYTNKINLDNTPALESAILHFFDNQETNISAVNSGAENVSLYSYNKTIDFSTNFTAAENLYLEDYTGTELNLANTTSLKTLTIINDRNRRQFETLHLPVSIENLNITGAYDDSKPSGILDMSKMQSLKKITIINTGITDIILTGIPALETSEFYSCTSLKSVSISGSGINSIKCNGCSALENIDLHDCSKLEFAKIYTSSLSVLNLQNCGILRELTVSGGKLQYVDLTTCRILYNIDINTNLIDTENLNRILTELPDRNSDVITGKLNVTGNPGAETCDRNIAYNKNWFFVD